MSSKIDDEEERQIFQVLDSDCDGKLNYAEFIQFLELNGATISESCSAEIYLEVNARAGKIDFRYATRRLKELTTDLPSSDLNKLNALLFLLLDPSSSSLHPTFDRESLQHLLTSSESFDNETGQYRQIPISSHEMEEFWAKIENLPESTVDGETFCGLLFGRRIATQIITNMTQKMAKSKTTLNSAFNSRRKNSEVNHHRVKDEQLTTIRKRAKRMSVVLTSNIPKSPSRGNTPTPILLNPPSPHVTLTKQGPLSARHITNKISAVSHLIVRPKTERGTKKSFFPTL